MVEIDVEKIREMRRNRATKKEICGAIGISRYKLDEILRENNIEKNRVADSKDEIYRLYVEEMLSIEEVSEILNVSAYTLRKRMKEMGIVARTRGGYTQKHREKCIKRKNERINFLEMPEYLKNSPERKPSEKKGVYCSREVCLKCAYGNQHNYCDYMLITEKPRPCSWQDCTVFKEGYEERKNYFTEENYVGNTKCHWAETDDEGAKGYVDKIRKKLVEEGEEN